MTEGILALCLSVRDPIPKFAVQITLRLSYRGLERLRWSDVSFLTDGNRGVGIRTLALSEDPTAFMHAL